MNESVHESLNYIKEENNLFHDILIFRKGSVLSCISGCQTMFYLHVCPSFPRLPSLLPCSSVVFIWSTKTMKKMFADNLFFPDEN